MVKSTRQIGKCGELLVQYRLLKHGIESAPLTTDLGIDLIAFPDIEQKPLKIQVKTSTHHGDVGERYLRWQIPEDCPADYVAAVDFERDKFWLIRTEEFKRIAYRRADRKLDLRLLLLGCESGRPGRKEEQFNDCEMEAAIPRIFGLK